MKGKGNGNHSYDFTYSLSFTGVAYYRIQQVDIDGRFTYSPVIKLSNALQSKLTVHPNPVASVATITTGTDLLNTKAVLTDLKGKNLDEFMITSRIATLDISKYTSGIYLLILADGSIKKIIKQ